MGESLKESLEAAYDEDTSNSEPDTVVEETPPVVDQSVVDDPPSSEESEARSEEGEPPSDESAGEPPVTEQEESEVQEEIQEEVQAATGLKPPPGWKPAMREKFKELPSDVQGEIIRREVDIAKGMEIASEARKFKQQFDQHVAPYAAEIASRGVTAMDAFDNYLSTAYALRHAPPMEKASLVAGMIQQYGVDIGSLDKILTQQIENPGAGSGNGVDPNVAAAVSQALKPYQQMFDSVQQNQIRTAEQTQVEVRSEIDVFQAKPENEFFQDVKADMATLLEAAAMRNTQMTLQEAYDRAILLRPDLAEIVARRKLQSEAEAKDEAAKVARAKAVGVQGGSPDTAGVHAQPRSLRGAIEAAIDSNDV